MKLPAVRLPFRRTSRHRPAEGSGPSVAALSRRVALTTTLIVAVAFAFIGVVVYAIVSNLELAQVDAHLADALRAPVGGGPRPGAFNPERQDPNRPFILMWQVQNDGSTVQIVGTSDFQTIALPSEYASVSQPQTVSLGGASYRIDGGETLDGRYVIAAESLNSVSNLESALVAAELGIGAALVIVVFLGAMAIGRRVAQPIEDSRQRQLEFTADASHELRTPLSVIEAQTTLALARERPGDWYRMAFTRVDGESKRIRRLVDDMLWLARFDATRGQPHAEPVDVNVLAGATVDRFRAVAETRRLALAVQGQDGSIVTVPPEWLDRLLGVLLDNACKYSPEGGAVQVTVTGDGKRVRLAVEDSGPGIPPAERERIFDRFHRATDAPGGAGLGLAIGDAIVRATNGRWQIGESPLGGASISITWPRSMSGTAGRRESHAAEDSRADARA